MGGWGCYQDLGSGPLDHHAKDNLVKRYGIPLPEALVLLQRVNWLYSVYLSFIVNNNHNNKCIFTPTRKIVKDYNERFGRYQVLLLIAIGTYIYYRKFRAIRCRKLFL